MSYSFAFDAARKRVLVTQESAETAQSALEAMSDVRNHPKFESDYDILCDFRKGDFPRGSVALAQVSQVITVFFPRQRIALVYSDPDREKSAQFVATAASTVANVRVFNDLQAAEAWLGAAPDG